MCDSNNEDHQFIVEHFVHHPVVADAYSAKAPQNSFQRVARVRLLGKAIDGVHNALTILASNLREVSGRAALDPNCVCGHRLWLLRCPSFSGRAAFNPNRATRV